MTAWARLAQGQSSAVILRRLLLPGMRNRLSAIVAVADFAANRVYREIIR